MDFSKLSLKGNDKLERREILRTKVRAVGKMAMLLKNIKSNSDILVEIKDMAPDGKIP